MNYSVTAVKLIVKKYVVIRVKNASLEPPTVYGSLKINMWFCAGNCECIF